MRLQRALLVVCGIALAACSDSPTAPTTVSGSLSFNYTGAGATAATTFSANGSLPTNIGLGGWGTNSWAAADVDAAAGETDIIASVPVTASTWNQAVITIDRTTVGNSTISSSCSAANCTSVTVIFGTNAGFTSDTYECELTTGTVNISSITSATVTGSFSGTGSCFNSLGAQSNFTVTSGVFSAGVASQLAGIP
jgi:hypothetical protein